MSVAKSYTINLYDCGELDDGSGRHVWSSYAWTTDLDRAIVASTYGESPRGVLEELGGKLEELARESGTEAGAKERRS